MSAPADRQARFDDLYRSFREPVLAFLLRRTDQPADAADALHEVFVVAWRRIDEVPADATGRMWLFGVAHNVLSNQRRGVRRRGQLADALAGALSRAARPAPTRQLSPVEDALAALSAEDRMLVTLRVWEDLTTDEIGTVLGMAPGTVRVRLHRARRRLRDALTASGAAGTRRGVVATLSWAEETSA